jgi:hypothetical protein
VKGLTTEAHKALAQLSAEELQHLILKLGFYALGVSSKLFWRTGNAVELPEGETCESIVSLALTKVLSGERRWDPDRAPDLQKYLMDTIDSLLSHLVTGKDNRLVRTLPTVSDTEAADVLAQRKRGHGTTPWQAQPTGNPETVLMQQEAAQHDAHVLHLLLEESRDDSVVTGIIQAMQDGHEKPGEIAPVLGIPVGDVYNAMKRLSRKIVQVRTRLRGPSIVSAPKGGRNHAGTPARAQ